MRKNLPSKKNVKRGLIKLESHRFVIPSDITDSGKGHRKNILEQDIHTVTKHHHTGYFLSVKDAEKRSGCHHYEQMINLSVNDMRFTLWFFLI